MALSKTQPAADRRAFGPARSLLRLITRPRELAAMCGVAARLVVVQVLLTFGGFALVRKACGYDVCDQTDREPGDMPALTPRQGWALTATTRLLDSKMLHVGCLPRSIVIEQVCRANGVAAEILIGVNKAEGFKAHAWVEIQGLPLGREEAGRAHWAGLGRFRSRRGAGTWAGSSQR